MPAGVGVLGAESGAEGVNLGQRQAVAFDVQLSGDGQEGLAPEEILREVDLALGGARQAHQVQRRNAKQLARTFRVRGGDDGRVHPDEAVLVEKAMDGLGDGVAHARHGGDDVGARAQMRDLAQELQRVRLGLDRVGVGVFDPADDPHLARLHLEGLALRRRRHDPAAGLDGAARRQAQHFRGVVGQRVGRHDLNRVKAGTVGQVDKGNAGFGIAPRAHPAVEGNVAIRWRASGKDIGTSQISHGLF